MQSLGNNSLAIPYISKQKQELQKTCKVLPLSTVTQRRWSFSFLKNTFNKVLTKGYQHCCHFCNSVSHLFANTLGPSLDLPCHSFHYSPAGREVPLPWSLGGQAGQKQTGRTYRKTQTQLLYRGVGKRHFQGKWALWSLSYPKIFKNSLKLVRFQIDVFKYSSLEEKCNSHYLLKRQFSRFEASYLHRQTFDYRHIWGTAFDFIFSKLLFRGFCMFSRKTMFVLL